MSVTVDSIPGAPLFTPISAFVSSLNKASTGSLSPLERGIALWESLQELVNNPEHNAKFLGSLTSTQLKSYRILDDWWQGRYHQRPANGDTAAFTLLLKNEEAIREELGPSHPKTTTYTGCMCNLFLAELIWWYQLFPNSNDISLNSGQNAARILQIFGQIGDLVTGERQRALKHATWQRISHSVWKEFESPTCRLSEAFLTMGSSLQACPWIGTSNLSRLPLYLWDRDEQRQIKTSDLEPSDQQYWCISHTWGRWRKGEADMKPRVAWAVPGNTRFHVEHLPVIFKALDWPVRYIWFDLFCIPQHDCPERAVEIAKQAEIFQQASRTVVWLNDVEDWKRLQISVSWLALQYLKKTIPGMPGIQKHLETVTILANELSTRLEHDDNDVDPWALRDTRVTDQSSTEKLPADPGAVWFSSLWTLQEAYLCPDAMLVDKQWNILRTEGGVPLTLDNVTSFTYSIASDVDVDEHRPGILDQLLFVVKRWELSNITSPSRMSVLIAANSREAHSPRAEAIMSALDVRDWYNEYYEKNGCAHPQKDLVLKVFPIEFIREARLKIGPSFFLTFRFPPNTVADATIGKPLGTMLPLDFSPDRWQTVMSLDFATSGWFQDTTEGWELQLDGSVLIKQAAVLAQSDGNPTALLEDGPVRIPSLEGAGRFSSLSAYFSSCGPAQHRFAVALVRYGKRQFGMVLEGIDSVQQDDALTLVKRAIFYTEGEWCQESSVRLESVNWRVL